MQQVSPYVVQPHESWIYIIARFHRAFFEYKGFSIEPERFGVNASASGGKYTAITHSTDGRWHCAKQRTAPAS